MSSWKTMDWNFPLYYLQIQFEIDAKPGIVAHACKPRSWEADTGGSLWVSGDPQLHSKFNIKLNYRAIPYLKNRTNKQKKETHLQGNRRYKR